MGAAQAAVFYGYVGKTGVFYAYKKQVFVAWTS